MQAFFFAPVCLQLFYKIGNEIIFFDDYLNRNNASEEITQLNVKYLKINLKYFNKWD